MIEILQKDDCFILYDDGKQVAICSYTVDGEISDITSENSCPENYLQAIVRATLSMFEKKGLMDIFSRVSGYDELFDKLRFAKDDDGIFRLNLEGYFGICPCCG